VPDASYEGVLAESGPCGEMKKKSKLTEIHSRIHLLMRLPEPRRPRTLVASVTRSLARGRRYDVRCGREEFLIRLRIIVVLGACTHVMCV
jgi:hypothetical protein